MHLLSRKQKLALEHAELEEKPSSSTATGESDDNIEEQTGLEIVDLTRNETESETYSANESGNQPESESRSIDFSTNQINVQQNHTATSDTMVDPATAVTDSRNQTTLHPVQDQNATANTLEVPWKEKVPTQRLR